MKKNTIAVFDLSLTSNSPVGSTLLKLIEGLNNDYRFVAFTDQFDESLIEKAHVVRVPLPARPVLFRYLIFYFCAPLYFKRYVQEYEQPDLIITAQGEFINCDISRAGFCHKAYLENHWQNIKVSGRLRRLARFINHKFNAFAEKKAFQNCNTVVVPSVGLAKELRSTYQALPSSRVVTINNPINTKEFKEPSSFDVNEFRKSLGYSPHDYVLSFVALGDFGRKGLDVLLEAVSLLGNKNCKILVVGGTASEISQYKTLAQNMELNPQIQFVGFKKDTRPYLWSSDLFVFPSAYETFSQVVFKAAAAGLPVITTKVYGVEDFVIDGVNGKLIERTAGSLSDALRQLLDQPDLLLEMGNKAQIMAEKYDTSFYLKNWKVILEEVLLEKNLKSHQLSDSQEITEDCS